MNANQIPSRPARTRVRRLRSQTHGRHAFGGTALICSLLALTIGCATTSGGQPSTDPAPPTTPTVSAPSPSVDGHWRLEAVITKGARTVVPADYLVTLSLSKTDRSYQLKTPCIFRSGTYNTEPGRIEFKAGGTTGGCAGGTASRLETQISDAALTIGADDGTFLLKQDEDSATVTLTPSSRNLSLQFTNR